MADLTTFESLSNDLSEHLRFATDVHSQYEIVLEYYSAEVPGESIPTGRVRRVFSALNQDCLNEHTVGMIADIVSIIATNRSPYAADTISAPASLVGGPAELHVTFLAVRQALMHSKSVPLLVAYARLIRNLVTASGYASGAGGTNAAVVAVTPTAVGCVCAVSDAVASSAPAHTAALLALAAVVREFGTAPRTAPSDGTIPPPIVKALLRPMASSSRSPVMAAGIAAMHAITTAPRRAQATAAVVGCLAKAGAIPRLAAVVTALARRIRADVASTNGAAVWEMVAIRRGCEALAALAVGASVDDVSLALGAVAEAAAVAAMAQHGGRAASVFAAGGTGGGSDAIGSPARAWGDDSPRVIRDGAVAPPPAGAAPIAIFGDAYGDPALQVDTAWSATLTNATVARLAEYVAQLSVQNVALDRLTGGPAGADHGGALHEDDPVDATPADADAAGGDGIAAATPQAAAGAPATHGTAWGAVGMDGRVDVPSELATISIGATLVATATALAALWAQMRALPRPDAAAVAIPVREGTVEAVASCIAALRDDAVWALDGDVASNSMAALVRLVSDAVEGVSQDASAPTYVAALATAVACCVSVLWRLVTGGRGLAGSALGPLAVAAATCMHRVLLLPEARATLCVIYAALAKQDKEANAAAAAIGGVGGGDRDRDGHGARAARRDESDGEEGTSDERLGALAARMQFSGRGANAEMRRGMRELLESTVDVAQYLEIMEPSAGGGAAAGRSMTCAWLDVILTAVSSAPASEAAAAAVLSSKRICERLVRGIRRSVDTVGDVEAMTCLLTATQIVAKDSTVRSGAVAQFVDDGIAGALLARLSCQRSSETVVMGALVLTGYIATTAVGRQALVMEGVDTVAVSLMRRLPPRHSPVHAALAWALAPILLAATATPLLSRRAAAAVKARTDAAAAATSAVSAARARAKARGGVGAHGGWDRGAGKGALSRRDSRVSHAVVSLRTIGSRRGRGEFGEGEASRAASRAASRRASMYDHEDARDEDGSPPRGSRMFAETHDGEGTPSNSVSHVAETPTPLGRGTAADAADELLTAKLMVLAAQPEDFFDESRVRDVLRFVRTSGVIDVLLATRAHSFGVLTWAQGEVVWATVAALDRRDTEIVWCDGYDIVASHEADERAALAAAAAASARAQRELLSRRVLSALKSPAETLASRLEATLRERQAREALGRTEIELSERSARRALVDAAADAVAHTRGLEDEYAAEARARRLEEEEASAAAAEEAARARVQAAEDDVKELQAEYERARARAAEEATAAQRAASDTLDEARERAATVMREAEDAAAKAKHDATSEADEARERARGEVARAKEEAARLLEEARAEAARVRDEAVAEAARVQGEAEIEWGGRIDELKGSYETARGEREGELSKALDGLRAEHEAAWEARYEELLRREEAALEATAAAQRDATAAMHQRERVEVAASEAIARVGLLALESATATSLFAQVGVPLEVARAREIAESEVGQLTAAVSGYTQRVGIVTLLQQVTIDEADGRAAIAGEAARTRMAVACAAQSAAAVIEGIARSDAARKASYSVWQRDIAGAETIFRRMLAGEEARLRDAMVDAAVLIRRGIDAARGVCARTLVSVNVAALVRREAVTRATVATCEAREWDTLGISEAVARDAIALRHALHAEAEASAVALVRTAAAEADARRASAVAVASVIMGPAMEAHEGLHRVAIEDAELSHRAALYQVKSDDMTNSVALMLTSALLQVQHEELEDRAAVDEEASSVIEPIHAGFRAQRDALITFERQAKGHRKREAIERDETRVRGVIFTLEHETYALLTLTHAATLATILMTEQQRHELSSEAILISEQQIFSSEVGRIVEDEAEERNAIRELQIADATELAYHLNALRDASRKVFATAHEATQAALRAAKGRADAAETQLALIAPDGVESLTLQLRKMSDALRDSELARRQLEEEVVVAKAAAKAAVKELVAERARPSTGVPVGALLGSGGHGVGVHGGPHHHHHEPPAAALRTVWGESTTAAATAEGAAVGFGLRGGWDPKVTGPERSVPAHLDPNTAGDYERFLANTGNPADRFLPEFRPFRDSEARNLVRPSTGPAAPRASGPQPLDRRGGGWGGAEIGATRMTGVGVTHIGGGDYTARRSSFVEAKRAAVHELRDDQVRI